MRFSSLFRIQCEINCIFTNSVRILCLSCNVNFFFKFKILLKRAKSCIVLFVYKDVLYHVSAYTVNDFYRRSTRIRHQKGFIRSMPIWPLKITQLQDKMIFAYCNFMRYIFEGWGNIIHFIHQVNSACLPVTCNYTYERNIINFCRIWEKGLSCKDVYIFGSSQQIW